MTPYAEPLAGAVLIVLNAVALLLAWRWRRDGSLSSPAERHAVAAPAPAPAPATDLGELLREAERLESRGWPSRGEQRLAEDVDRWRQRQGGGRLPAAAAGSGRHAAARGRS